MNSPVTQRHRELAFAAIGAEPGSHEYVQRFIRTGLDTATPQVYPITARIAQALADIEAAALASRTAVEWVAVSERMPPTGLTVLIDGGCAFFDGINWRSMTGGASGKKIEWHVTHWMPLPAPPTESRKP